MVSILAELSSVVVLWLRGRALLAAALFWLGFHVFTVALLYIHFAPTVVCWLAFAPLERLAALVARAAPAARTAGPDPAAGRARARAGPRLGRPEAARGREGEQHEPGATTARQRCRERSDRGRQQPADAAPPR